MKDDNLGTHETCSLCTTEIKWVDLIESNAGNICLDCFEELLEGGVMEWTR